jgi:hypothetical protein
LAVIQRNMTEYGDQYAVAVNFLIRRGFAREQTVHGGPRAGAAHARTGGGLARLRSSAAEFILEAICSVIQSGGKAANARLVAAAIRDTREVWASNFLPQDRTRMIELLADLSKRVSDETARIDLAAFTAALQAVN